MSPHSSGTESQQLRMTVSPSHSSLEAKKALGVNLPPQVLSVISVAAHSAGQRQQQEDTARGKHNVCLMEWQQEKLVFIEVLRITMQPRLWNALPISCKPCAGFRPRLETSRALCGSFASQYTAWEVRHTCVQTGACRLHVPLCFRDVTNEIPCGKKGSSLLRKVGRQLWKT